MADQLRDAVRRAERRGITRYRIAKESGVSQAQLTRLVHKTCGLQLSSAERLAKALGCRLIVQCEDGT